MRTLLILLFVSFNGFSQTYDDIMSINSLDSFEKVVIENGYELVDYKAVFEMMGAEMTDSIKMKLDDVVMYSKGNIIAGRTFTYEKSTGKFSLTYPFGGGLMSLFTDNEVNIYEEITKEIKSKCNYQKTVENNGRDYVTYSCPESSYKGKIGIATIIYIGFLVLIIV